MADYTDVKIRVTDYTKILYNDGYVGYTDLAIGVMTALQPREYNNSSAPAGFFLINAPWTNSNYLQAVECYNSLLNTYNASQLESRNIHSIINHAPDTIIRLNGHRVLSELQPKNIDGFSVTFEHVTIPDIPEVFDTSLDYVSAALIEDMCLNVRYNFKQNFGAYPIKIDYTGLSGSRAKIVNNSGELFIEMGREGVRTVFFTDANQALSTITLPLIGRNLTPTATYIQSVEGGTDVTINGVSSQPQSIDLEFKYSNDNVNFSYSNLFPDVPTGINTFYVKDKFGCVKEVSIEIPELSVSEVFAIHNPLNFIIEKQTFVDFVLCDILVNNNNIGTFRAIPLDESGGKFRYILFADEPIRAYMPLFDDYPQTIDTFSPVTNIAAGIEIKETVSGGLVVAFFAVNAARQIGGDGARMLDVVNNNESSFIFVEGQPAYVYFYDNAFFREKILLTSSTTIIRNGISKKVEVIPYCDGDIVLKYLDRNGMYRFYKFSRMFERRLEPSKIGQIESIFENIATAQGTSKNIGYNNDKKIDITAFGVPDSHMESLQDIFVSPRIYMHVGAHGLDDRSNWILVDVYGEGIIKHPKRKFNDLKITLTLPQQYNVTML